MISNNYIPEKINDANAYLDGTRMIGVAASVDLPEVNMKTGTVEGFGVGGEIDSPTIGQWESFEQEVQFNTLYSSAVDMLNPLTVVNLTFRAAQQVYDKTGGSVKPGPAKVTAVATAGKHPYHLVHTDGTSTVYGWVDAAAITGKASATPAVKTYTVKAGDSLWRIAAQQLGNGARYKEIKTLNGLKNDTIHAGQILKLPN